MAITFQHVPHPHIAARKKTGAPKTTDENVGFNGKIALILTTIVGTMWCAYAFALLALVALPFALPGAKQGDVTTGGVMQTIQWVSQTFIQLTMLSVIMVGQNILARSSDKRADMTYQDADATFHESEQIQAHLLEQDAAINTLLDKILKLETALSAKQ
jgi:hypothetical protein